MKKCPKCGSSAIENCTVPKASTTDKIIETAAILGGGTMVAMGGPITKTGGAYLVHAGMHALKNNETVNGYQCGKCGHKWKKD